jgi:hypothetical protein
VGTSLAAVQHAVADTLLWNLRVLAGWLPREGVAAVRALAAWFELADVDERIRVLTGLPAGPPHRLGGLATAWSRLEPSASLPDLRARLTRTTWGDPGGNTAWQIQLALRLAWAERVAREAPPAAGWAAAGAALLFAREVVEGGRRLPPRQARAVARLLGPAASARDLSGLAAALPPPTAWVLDGIAAPEDLWRAEPRFWRRIEADAFALTRSSGFGLPRIIGTVGLLAADAWRVRAALTLADHGPASVEVLDAVV